MSRIEGRTKIKSAFRIKDWRTIEKLAERVLDPLDLQWDALGRPWLDVAQTEAWMTRNNRGHRWMRVEKRIRADPRLYNALADLLPGGR